jgi:hypothetical protein
VGIGVAVGAGVAVAVGVGVRVGVGTEVWVGVAVGGGVAVAVGVAVTVGVGEDHGMGGGTTLVGGAHDPDTSARMVHTVALRNRRLDERGVGSRLCGLAGTGGPLDRDKVWLTYWLPDAINRTMAAT